MRSLGLLLMVGSAQGVYAQDAGAPDAGADAGMDATVDGTVQNGTVQNGTVQNGTVQNGTVQNGTVQNGTPWEGGTPALPSFLDTTDTRIGDDRPPPTAQQVAALREMEAELARFSNTGGSYRDTVVSLVRREYLRQRRGRDQWYARQIREEERLMDEARNRAIEQFERFIARYPNDPTYTPDAMFRLGELYFERSSIDFQRTYDEALARRDAGETDAELPETVDFNPTIELYQRLVRNFRDYRRRDGVYYLIGYCLNEMGRYEEALHAWLNLVCANRFTYDPDALPEGAEGEETEGEGEDGDAAEHPALTLDGEVNTTAEAMAALEFENPYVECQPVMEEAQFLSETWFRIGEYHFDDYGNPHALELSIAAYNKILEDPEDRNYNLALYKVAWAYYRASRYPEAIRAFGDLVQWSDDEQRRTGAAGSQLRPEAIQYLGIAFAYDDWNENGLPDTIEGQPTGLVRIQDASLLPQDREWTPEVYFQLGQVYFDEARYPEAIAVWRLALSRWPNHPQAPEITNQIAQAHQRNNEMELAIAARSELTGYGEGSEWWNDNVDHPTEQRRAEQLAESALIATALQEHAAAQTQRRRCVEHLQAGEADATSICNEATQHYRNAAEAYRGYLNQYPNNPQAYELRYNLADALYWSENYEEAAVEYAIVRDSNLDDAHLAEAARRVVESLGRLVENAARDGQIQLREDPPAPVGTPPGVRPVEMPQLVQRLAQARELYIARVSERQDSEHVRAPYEYNNAVLLYQYGYWPQAKERFERIFDERCAGANANETGLTAWETLRAMAIALNQTDEIERLATQLSERQCTFDPQGEACPTGEQLEALCRQPDEQENRCCRARGDLTAIEFRRALEQFTTAESASGDAQTRGYELAASMLVEAVNGTPGHPQAPLALEYAATALERTQRFDSARQLYQRIIDEVGPQTGDTPERQAELDAIVGNAYFRVAYNANRGFEFDEAVRNYRVLVDSRRFSSSSNPRIQRYRLDSLVNTALLLEKLQRYDEAVRYYNDILSTPSADAATKRTAAYQIGEIAFKRRNWNLTIREMNTFITRYRGDAAAGELWVQAHWRIAQARKELNQTRDYNTALTNTVQAFNQAGQARGSIAAEYAANAAFILANANLASFESFSINTGNPSTLEEYIASLRSQVDSGSRQAQTLVEGLSRIPDYGRPTWTIAAFVQQGRVYEVLARGVLNAPVPFVLPAEQARALRGQRLNADTREELRIVIEDTLRQVLDQLTRPIECLGVARYALAARAARAGSIDNEYTRVAIDRIQAYGDERIAECVAEAAARDASFAAYQAGEFARAPRGQTMQIEAGVSAPALESR